MAETSYRIEIREAGRWIAAPGESTGWTLDGARQAMRGPMYGLDGSAIEQDQIRIVDEQTGEVVE